MDNGHLSLAATADTELPRQAAVPDRSSPRRAHVARAARPAVLVGEREMEPHALAVAATDPAPVVSIIIVSHNCKGPLQACLRSLDEERQLMPLEVILVDNDSRDDTGYAVASEFPWVQLIVNRHNVGFARAINEGLRFAKGDYLLLLNPDTVVPAGTTARIVGELERRPDVGMLGCKLVRPDGTFDHACKRGFPTVLSAVYYFTGLARAFPDSPRLAQYTAAHLGIDETGTVDAINGAFMLVRRSAADDVGSLDERYWLWAEDLDWCHRFWEKGWKVLLLARGGGRPPRRAQASASIARCGSTLRSIEASGSSTPSTTHQTAPRFSLQSWPSGCGRSSSDRPWSMRCGRHAHPTPARNPLRLLRRQTMSARSVCF